MHPWVARVPGPVAGTRTCGEWWACVRFHERVQPGCFAGRPRRVPAQSLQ